MPMKTLSFLLAGVAVMFAAAPAVAQPVRVSVSTDGTPGDGESRLPTVSADGRFVAFVSAATNLVSGDTNGYDDVFLRDRDTDGDGVFDEPGAVSTVRIQRPGIQPNGTSFEPRITPDGRYVVFPSTSSSLFADPSNGPLAYGQIFRWDRQTGEIIVVSRNTAGEILFGPASSPAVTSNGNVVYFVSHATNDGGGDAGEGGLILRRNIGEGTLVRVSHPIPAGSTLHAESPAVSADGSVFAYAHVVIDSGRYPGTVYAHAAGQPVRTFHGAHPQLSSDGQFLAFIYSQAHQVHLPSGQVVSVGAIGAPLGGSSALSPSGRYFRWTTLPLVDFIYGSAAGVGEAFGETVVAYTLVEYEPMRQIRDVVVEPLAAQLDVDGDGLVDHWETAFGSSIAPGSGGSGDDGAAGDPDGDGLTNAQELARGTHPRGTAARYLAEGASGTFFQTRYAIANPGGADLSAAVRLETDGGGVVARVVNVPSRGRVTIDSRALGMGTASFSAAVESAAPLVVDRLMAWGDQGQRPFGSHAETSRAAAGTSWFFAEGSTVLGFQLFYLLQNPQATATTATIRFLLPSGSPIVRSYALAPRSRTTVYVNAIPGLASTDVAAEIVATAPIAAERAMYRDGSQVFTMGHAAAGVAQPSASWLFGEGATGTFFDTYLLFANPSSQAASVQVQYLRDVGGPVARAYTVPASGRLSVFVDGEPGLAAAAFGTRVTSNVPIVAERAMYWAGGFFDYYEGHVSAGATQTGSRWVLAEGEQGGRYDAQTFVLIANTGATPASIVVRGLPEGPSLPQTTGTFTIAAHSRVTLPLTSLPHFTRGGVEVLEQGTSTGALIVEGAIYWTADGVPFAAGANWPATRIP